MLPKSMALRTHQTGSCQKNRFPNISQYLAVLKSFSSTFTQTLLSLAFKFRSTGIKIDKLLVQTKISLKILIFMEYLTLP